MRDLKSQRTSKPWKLDITDVAGGPQDPRFGLVQRRRSKLADRDGWVDGWQALSLFFDERARFDDTTSARLRWLYGFAFPGGCPRRRCYVWGFSLHPSNWWSPGRFSETSPHASAACGAPTPIPVLLRAETQGTRSKLQAPKSSSANAARSISRYKATSPRIALRVPILSALCAGMVTWCCVPLIPDVRRRWLPVCRVISFVMIAAQQTGQILSAEVPAAASSRNNLVLDHVEADHRGFVLRIEVATDRIAQRWLPHLNLPTFIS